MQAFTSKASLAGLTILRNLTICEPVAATPNHNLQTKTVCRLFTDTLVATGVRNFQFANCEPAQSREGFAMQFQKTGPRVNPYRGSSGSTSSCWSWSLERSCSSGRSGSSPSWLSRSAISCSIVTASGDGERAPPSPRDPPCGLSISGPRVAAGAALVVAMVRVRGRVRRDLVCVMYFETGSRPDLVCV